MIEKDAYYFGGHFGVTPDPGLVRLGGFMGHTRRVGILVSSMSVGLGVNFSRVNAWYKDTEWKWDGFLPTAEVTFDSSFGGKGSAEVPLRAGVLLDIGPVSPYVSASLNILGLSNGGGRDVLALGEGGAGLQWRFGSGMLARVEGTFAGTRTDRGLFVGPRYGTRLDFAREF